MPVCDPDKPRPFVRRRCPARLAVIEGTRLRKGAMTVPRLQTCSFLLCTGQFGNGSILGEIARRFSSGNGRFKGFSAGSQTKEARCTPIALRPVEQPAAFPRRWPPPPRAGTSFAEAGCAPNGFHFHRLPTGAPPPARLARRGRPSDDRRIGGVPDPLPPAQGHRDRASAPPSARLSQRSRTASRSSSACRLGSLDKMTLQARLDAIGRKPPARLGPPDPFMFVAARGPGRYPPMSLFRTLTSPSGSRSLHRGGHRARPLVSRPSSTRSARPSWRQCQTCRSPS